MSHDEVSIIENVMADESVKEVRYFDAKFRCFLPELFHRFGQTVSAFDISAAQRPDQFHVMIPGSAERLP